jgi:hypothetical protein
MPRSLVSQAGPLAMRLVLAADATYFKRSLMFQDVVHELRPKLSYCLLRPIF